MREIKFRGKRFIDGKWVYGNLVETGFNYQTMIVVSARWSEYENGNVDLDETEAYTVDPETIGQYTGLKDKNGRNIYEGDIVHSKTLVNGFESIGQVIFRDAHFLFQAINSQFGSSGWVSDLGIVLKEYEVIGNIYENPDLLKEGKANG